MTRTGQFSLINGPSPPHEQIIQEFNSQFDRQFKSRYANTNHYPVWIGDGSTGMSPSFPIQSDF